MKVMQSFIRIFLASLILSVSPVQARENLQGKIELLINNPNAKIPVELQAIALKLEQTPSRPQTLQAELKSFPVILRGEWRGQLKISNFTCSDSFLMAQPEDAEREQQVVNENSNAEAYFRFYTTGARIVTMAPPEVKIPISQGKPSKTNSDYIYVAASDLDSSKYYSLSGKNKIKLSLLKNDVRLLAPNIVEQDMIISSLLTDKVSGKQTRTYEEIVYRFTKIRPFELNVQVADIRYGSNGEWWSKTLMDGTVH